MALFTQSKIEIWIREQGMLKNQLHPTFDYVQPKFQKASSKVQTAKVGAHHNIPYKPNVAV